MNHHFFSSLAYHEVKLLLSKDPRFSPFHFLLEHEPLLKFVYYEKCGFIGQTTETRIAYEMDSTTKRHRAVAGYRSDIVPGEKNIYHPNVFLPFEIKGLWLPVQKGALFSTLNRVEDCPLIKIKDKQHYILFLIHPQSEHFYASLLNTHKNELVTLSCLSLSSFRTVLIALPQFSGHFIPVMVKLTLNEEHGGVLRVLNKRDCALSIGNSKIFSQKLKTKNLNFAIFEEPLAYVPQGYEAGMLYRQLPDCLNPKLSNQQGLFPIPLFSLQGVKNRHFFQEIINLNGENPTLFFNTFLFSFAGIYCELLFNLHISIQAHAQNLLLLIDKENQMIGFMYRDMAGVNQLLTSEELSTLPANLRDPNIYYFATHILDASKALEQQFVLRCLTPLTRQLVKDRSMQKTAPLFKAWYNTMKANNYLQNWTLEHSDNDEYQMHLSVHHFYRYGYIETLFMHALIATLKQIKSLDKKWLQKQKQSFLHYEKINTNEVLPPCVKKPFFSVLINALLKDHLIDN